MIKTQEDFFIKIFLPLSLLQGFEKGYSGFACERELENEFWPQSHGRRRCVFLVLLIRIT